MNQYSFTYAGYLVIITEDPIYNDYRFVVKTLDEKKVVGANSYYHDSLESAEIAARELINNLK